MQILKKHPEKAYYGTHLWLPKSHFSESQLRGSLSFDLGPAKAPLEIWEEERHHWLVPRNYIATQTLHRLPYGVVDARLRSFPHVSIKSRVTLDAKDPSKHFQREGSKALLETHDGILCLRCGAGKTIVAIHSACQLNVPILILVTDLGLAEQWREEILEYTNLREEDVGFVGDGEFNWKRPLTIGLVQSFAKKAKDGKLPSEVVEWFGCVITDECHVMGAPYFNLALPPFHGRRWGLSATPRRSDGFDSLLKYTLGDVVYTFLEPELIPLVFFRKLPTRLDLRDPLVREMVNDKLGEVHLRKLYTYLTTREERTKVIVDEIRAAVNQGRQVLVLSQSRAMVEKLGEFFPKGGIVHGGVKDRKERLRRIRECNPVIAIDILGRQALNKPKLDTLLVCEPFSNMDVIQQIMGRVQRLYDGKKQPLVVFYDDHQIDEVHGICLKIRGLLSRWPKHMGGRIPFKNI